MFPSSSLKRINYPIEPHTNYLPPKRESKKQSVKLLIDQGQEKFGLVFEDTILYQIGNVENEVLTFGLTLSLPKLKLHQMPDDIKQLVVLEKVLKSYPFPEKIRSTILHSNTSQTITLDDEWLTPFICHFYLVLSEFTTHPEWNKDCQFSEGKQVFTICGNKAPKPSLKKPIVNKVNLRLVDNAKRFTQREEMIPSTLNPPKCGYSIVQDSNRSVHIGYMDKNKKRNGKGIYILPNGGIIYSSWKDGDISGIGLLFSVNGTVYNGNIENNRFSKFGTMYYKNQSYYCGLWENSQYYRGDLFIYHPKKGTMRKGITPDCNKHFNFYVVFYENDYRYYSSTID